MVCPVCFTLTCAIATPTFQQYTIITDGTGKESQECNTGPYAEWLLVLKKKKRAVKVSFMKKIWLCEPDDLMI